ncbi:protein app1-like [Cimex lectularius]|uniref:CPR type cuticle protein n=1 Tax=Cimex lectularius TaxID=79782 RepID=A0A8I6SGG3_CIMLE|nr:protein app1-like [Cimex lectularius]
MALLTVVLSFALLASSSAGVLPVVTYGTSYSAHSVDHSLAAPVVPAVHAVPALPAVPAVPAVPAALHAPFAPFNSPVLF